MIRFVGKVDGCLVIISFDVVYLISSILWIDFKFWGFKNEFGIYVFF